MEMANMVEKWLDNLLVKSMLGFCTKRETCGRRIELVLKDYVEGAQELCLGCKLSKFIVSKILNCFLSQAKVDKEDVLENLRDPMWRKGLSSVLEGIAKYGPQKPFTAYSLFLIVWNFTNACNLSCRHCYEDAHQKMPDELTTKEAKEAVDKMADSGVAYIAVSGGEPLMREDFFEVAR